MHHNEHIVTCPTPLRPPRSYIPCEHRNGRGCALDRKHCAKRGCSSRARQRVRPRAKLRLVPALGWQEARERCTVTRRTLALFSRWSAGGSIKLGWTGCAWAAHSAHAHACKGESRCHCSPARLHKIPPSHRPRSNWDPAIHLMADSTAQLVALSLWPGWQVVCVIIRLLQCTITFGAMVRSARGEAGASCAALRMGVLALRIYLPT